MLLTALFILANVEFITSSPIVEAKYCDDRVCLSVCEHVQNHMFDLYQFFCMLLMFVARSSSGSIAMLCTLHVIGR